jgi:hypothetical protein
MDERELLCMRLRQRAARCRGLARDAVSLGVAEELDAIAADYERDADKIEAQASRHTRSAAA